MLAYANLGYGIIDADQHWDGTDLAHDLFASRLANKFKDRAPKWIKLDEGLEAISFNDGARTIRLATQGDLTYGGTRKPAGVSVKERLHDMDLDGIAAAVLYSVEVPIHEAYSHDAEMIVPLIEAYNDYKVEEISTESGNRLFTTAMLPQTGVKEAVEEMERCMAKGHKGVTPVQWPSGPDPSPEDDYFWAAAAAGEVPVCIHAVNNFGGPEAITRAVHQAALGVRFPGLRIGLVEQGAGWIPYYLQTADASWLSYRQSEGLKTWLESRGLDPELRAGGETLAPSESFHRVFSATFEFDQLGVELRHYIGVEKMMWSTDYPHGKAFWPRSRLEFDHLFSNVEADEVKAMVHGNAKRFYHLDEVQ